MILVPRPIPWQEQPWGGPAPNQLLGVPVFTFDGARGPVDLIQGNAGALTGTGATLGAGRAGLGFNSSATAGNRLSWAHQSAYELSESAPVCILLCVDVRGFHETTPGYSNDLIAQADANSSTGWWRLCATSDGAVKWEYRRSSGAVDLGMQWAGAFPASGVATVLLVHEKQSNPNPWRLWVNGVDKGYAADATYNGSEFQAGGTNALSIGSSAGNTTRGVKGIYSLAHIAKRGLPTDGLARDISANPWLIFEPQKIWVPGSISSGVSGTSASTNANDTASAVGATTVIGTVAKTNANDTSSAAGTTSVTGTVAKANANDTVSASGAVGGGVSGAVAATNVNDTATAAGAVTIVGSVARTNTNDTVTASGVAGSISGSVATINANDSISAVGSSGAGYIPASSQGAFGGGGGKAFKELVSKLEKDIERRVTGQEVNPDVSAIPAKLITPTPQPKVAAQKTAPAPPSDPRITALEAQVTRLTSLVHELQATQKVWQTAENDEEEQAVMALLLH